MNTLQTHKLLYIITVSRSMVERALLSGSIAAALAINNEAEEFPTSRGSKPGWKINGRIYPHFNRVPSSPVFWFLEVT